eukprot:scaffold1_cov375-Pavlova_lutheri.AAC.23
MEKESSPLNTTTDFFRVVSCQSIERFVALVFVFPTFVHVCSSSALQASIVSFVARTGSLRSRNLSLVFRSPLRSFSVVSLRVFECLAIRCLGHDPSCNEGWWGGGMPLLIVLVDDARDDGGPIPG